MISMAKRTDIINAMKTRFQAIKVTGGYQTNLGSNVSVWRTSSYQPQELPALNIRDIKDDIVDVTQGAAHRMPSLHSMTVELDITVANKTATIETVRKCLEDVEAAIVTDEYWSGKALRTMEEKNEITIAQDEDTISGMMITLRIDYRTEKFKPN